MECDRGRNPGGSVWHGLTRFLAQRFAIPWPRPATHRVWSAPIHRRFAMGDDDRKRR